jgi:hypothetical protein
MHQQQQPEPGGIERVKANVNRGLFVCESVAITVEVFLHERNFGERCFGFKSLVGAGLIFLFAGFGAPHSPAPLLLFLGAYLLMHASCRMESRRAVLRGEVRHSRYNGTPRLARLLPRLDELTIKRYVEPAAVGILGLIVSAFAPPLGCYLIVAAIGLGFSVAQVVHYERAKATAAMDSLIESRLHAARIRERMGGMGNLFN